MCSGLYDVHTFPVALLHPWVSAHLVHSWEGGGCLSKRCAVLSAMEMEHERVGGVLLFVVVSQKI